MATRDDPPSPDPSTVLALKCRLLWSGWALGGGTINHESGLQTHIAVGWRGGLRVHTEGATDAEAWRRAAEQAGVVVRDADSPRPAPVGTGTSGTPAAARPRADPLSTRTS